MNSNNNLKIMKIYLSDTEYFAYRLSVMRNRRNYFLKFTIRKYCIHI